VVVEDVAGVVGAVVVVNKFEVSVGCVLLCDGGVWIGNFLFIDFKSEIAIVIVFFCYPKHKFIYSPCPVCVSDVNISHGTTLYLSYYQVTLVLLFYREHTY